MKVSILGAGSWGTALSIHLARVGHEVVLWARDNEVVLGIETQHRHSRRYTDMMIPAAVHATASLKEACESGEILVLSVPCASFRSVLEAAPRVDPGRKILSTAKGLEPDTGKRMSEIVREYSSGAQIGVLSGPTFAQGVVRGDPTAAVVADPGQGLARQVQESFSSPLFRLYSSDDLIGVELCGALKNVVAIAAGIVSGLGYGHNTLAALVTRGLAEIGRIVRGKGGQARTVAGLAGIGDLMLTCTGKQSRNRGLGEEIGKGRKLSEVLLEMPEVAEGARTCLAVPKLAAEVGVEAPIAEAVVHVLYDGVDPATAVEALMTRTLRPE
jgi:glycerol-3-phosphate dehydrogenase (NAD(P)+)